MRPPTGARLVGSRSRQKVYKSRIGWEEHEREAQEALRVSDAGSCASDGSGGE